MLKRSLLAVALAASTVLVFGSASEAAQASDARACASARQAGHIATTARPCEWRGDCYWCYRNGQWKREFCKGGSR